MERIISNIYQVAKKWEFIYKNKYHKDKVQYPVKEGIPYVICYGTDKKEMYLDGKNNILIRLKNHTLYSKYAKTGINLKREVYLKPHKIIMTQKIRNRGFISRYFAKYKLSEYYDKVFEINKQNFIKRTLLYDKVSISWQLEGTKEEVLKCSDGYDGPNYWELFAAFYYNDLTVPAYCRMYARPDHPFKTPGMMCLNEKGVWETE